jgi:hypothetical protein
MNNSIRLDGQTTESEGINETLPENTKKFSTIRSKGILVAPEYLNSDKYVPSKTSALNFYIFDNTQEGVNIELIDLETQLEMLWVTCTGYIAIDVRCTDRATGDVSVFLAEGELDMKVGSSGIRDWHVADSNLGEFLFNHLDEKIELIIHDYDYDSRNQE